MFPQKVSNNMTIREFINKLYTQKNFVKSEDSVSQAVNLGSYVLDGDGFGAVYNFQEENLIIIEDGDKPSDIKQTVHRGISYHTIQMIAGEIRMRHYDNGNGYITRVPVHGVEVLSSKYFILDSNRFMYDDIYILTEIHQQIGDFDIPTYLGYTKKVTGTWTVDKRAVEMFKKALKIKADRY